MDDKEPTAVEIALKRLATLTQSGAPPARVTETVGQIIAAWAACPEMDAVTAQARIEEIWNSISRDADELQEQVADTEAADPQALATAKRILKAMQAAVTALSAAHARF